MLRSNISVDPRVRHGLAALLMGVIAALSWSLGYLPAHRALRKTRHDVTMLQADITQLQARLAAAGGEAAWRSKQQQRVSALQRRVAPAAQTPRLLDAVIALVGDVKLKVGGVSQGNPEPVKDAQGQPVMLEQRACIGVPVTVTVDGGFHGIRMLLERLADASFPSLVTIDQLRLTMTDVKSAALHGTIKLTLDVLS